MMPESSSQERSAREPRAEDLLAVQEALIREIDRAIGKVELARADDTLHEHFDVLRATLSGQVRAYLEHLVARRSVLQPHTSVMYAKSAAGVAEPGALATTFRGLLEARTLTVGQGARLMGLATDHRTLLVFGDPETGKSTLLNSLFEVIGVDERLVAIGDGLDLPALSDRSFCVRLGIGGDTDLAALFGKAQCMNPSRLVIGELQALEMRGFFTMLAQSARIGGMGTLQATTVEEALAVIGDGIGGDDEYARQLVAQVRPVFLHMLRDANNQPKLAGLWSVDGLSRDALALSRVETPSPRSAGLSAEV